ncbi:MAG: methionine--tRNA ligase subunit beta [Candidatus Vogelbacteria bacterium CG22_combo_CG10-13_8_21_14_all_37_9]|uniref:Methionine--tRNA ligase n=1 Tax=Candidatus Vogelbacteria bacterium CG22_combo_CG10-13_8_21_14_all_37_9 TaxID=1975046 RepID=A0A2H0BL77_9BACT|nr:MAG: methionine--tRNA ligase subunit beta [Candidatus Vogelbacteria bacterium CG22_combo_CG10-13_8_21_14_all_37_9]
MISYDQFKESDLRVATVLSAERVDGSDKLLKLELDLETEKRQIIAGIGKAYEPESLVGQQITIIVNLEPRILLGLESQGMVLAAHGENGEAVLLRPDRVVPNGSNIS